MRMLLQGAQGPSSPLHLTTLAALTLLLALLAVAPTAQAGCGLSDFQAVKDGYSFRIVGGPSIVDLADLENVSVLRLWDPKLGTSFVEGRARVILRDVILFETQETLRFTPQSTTEIAVGILASTTGTNQSCWAAEFGVGCNLSWCAGTTYCLPGHGPNGVTCSCV